MYRSRRSVRPFSGQLNTNTMGRCNQVNKTTLIDQLAERSGVTRRQAEALLNNALSIITETLKTGEKVQISGFGTFEVKDRAPRCGRNPATGEMIPIAATKAPVFKPGQALKETIAE